MSQSSLIFELHAGMLPRPSKVEMPTSGLRHVHDRRVDLARRRVGRLRGADDRGCLADRMRADRERCSVARFGDDPQDLVCWTVGMTSAQRIAEQKACGERRSRDRIGQTIWVVVRAGIIDPGGHTAFQDLGTSAPTRHHDRRGQRWPRARCGQERRRGQGLQRRLRARSEGERRSE
jgi:hypothetical protein